MGQRHQFVLNQYLFTNKMKQRGFAHILILIVIVIIGGVLLINKNKLTNFVNIGNPSSTQSSDVTTDWKIYEDNDYGFVLKYPNSLMQTNVVKQGQALNKNLISSFHLDDISTEKNAYAFTIYKSNSSSINIWAQENGLELKDAATTYENTNIGTVYVIRKPGLPPQDQSINRTDTLSVFFRNNYAFVLQSFSFAGLGNENTATQILSTFKFTDGNNSSYSCPHDGYTDCMPMLDDKGWIPVDSVCNDRDYLNWAEANCPGFQGVAY